MSRLCFGFLVTVTFLQLTELVGGDVCMPLPTMLLGNFHTRWELPARTVRRVLWTEHSTLDSLASLEKNTNAHGTLAKLLVSWV